MEKIITKEKINFGDYFVIWYINSEMPSARLEIEGLGGANDVVKINTELKSATENTLDDELFNMGYELEVNANLLPANHLYTVELKDYKKIVSEAIKVMDFVEANAKNSISRLTGEPIPERTEG